MHSQISSVATLRNIKYLHPVLYRWQQNAFLISHKIFHKIKIFVLNFPYVHSWFASCSVRNFIFGSLPIFLTNREWLSTKKSGSGSGVRIGSEKKVTPDSDSRSRKIGIGSRFGSRFGSDFFKIGSGFLSLQEPFQEPIQGHFGGTLGAISGASLGSFCGLENGRFWR